MSDIRLTHEGVVTYKNDQFLYFKLDNIIVNAASYLAMRSPYNITMPELGEKLTIRGAHVYDENIQGNTVTSLCTERKLKKFSSSATKGLYYLWMIDDYNMGLSDSFQVIEMFESIKNSLTPEMETDAGEVILRFIEELLIKKECEEKQMCCSVENKLPKLECKTISQCKQIQVRGDGYKGFPYWSFGNHMSLSGEVLIGYFFVHPTFGTICLKDASYTIGCVIIKDSNDDLADILNRIVYIRKYVILTEIFNPNTKFNLEYVLLKFNDIGVAPKRKCDDSIPAEPSLQFKIQFVVLSKSNVTYSQRRGCHFWLEIEERESKYLKGTTKCFLSLPENLIEKWPYLEVSYMYTMCFSKHLERISDAEYTRVNPKVPQYLMSKTNTVELSQRGQLVDVVKLPFLNKSTWSKILDQKGLVSFQAVLKYRKFNPANSSRTNTQNVPPGFGTLGEKTHLLDFQVDDVKTLVLYMNNWECIAMPIGLIPGVLVNVRNVLVQKTYCKATPLTSLEVVKYEPISEYVTAKLLSDEDWGTPFPMAKHIPDTTLVYSTADTFYVKKLSMRRNCSKCFYMSESQGDACVKCKSPMELTCRFIVNIDGAGGTARIIMHDPDLVRPFLQFSETQWQLWKIAFEEVGYYYFQRNRSPVDNSNYKQQFKFSNGTTEIIKTNEAKCNQRIHLMCRKMNNERNYDQNETLWFGVKARI